MDYNFWGNLPFFNSFYKAQSKTVCGICKESPLLKWICIECDLYLCQNCYIKFHSKSKILALHLVIDIKEYGTKQMSERILKAKLKEIICEGTGHCDQKCNIFCKDCNKPICSGCMIKYHKEHILVELNEIFEQKISNFKDIKVKNNENISLCQHEKKELLILLSKGNKLYNETKSKILQNKKELTDHIQKHFDNLLRDGTSQWHITKDAINREIERIQGNIHQMEEQKEQLDQIVNPYQISEIITLHASPITKDSSTEHVHLRSLQQAKFKPGFISTNHDDNFKYFGHLYKGPYYKMIGSFSTKMRYVSKIIHLQNNSGIIANYKDELIQRVKFEIDDVTVENEIKTKVFDLAVMPNGNLLVSKETSDLELISMNGERELFHSFSPFLTFGVYVLKEEIFVGVAKPVEKSKKYKDGKIVVLDIKGQVKDTFEKIDKAGNSLFTCPTRIAACFDIICVVDTLDIEKDRSMLSYGRIVGIDNKGEGKWTYSNKLGAFFDLIYPHDITVTSAGLILISDFQDNAIHAINKDGDVTGWVRIQDIGYSNQPTSLDIDEQGILWVGCGEYQYQQREKNKIFSFKISIFGE